MSILQLAPPRHVPSADRLAGALSRLARRHGVPGGQLAVRRAGRTVAVSFGEVRHGTGRPVTGDTAFPVGSITKYCTAATALVLVAEGDLDLDEPLGAQVPRLPAACADVTLRQALGHTAGLPAGPGAEVDPSVSVSRYLAEQCRAGGRVLPPGAGFSYSNVGYVLAGLVIATVTGMAWEEAVGAILLRPAGIAPARIAAGARRAAGDGREVAAGSAWGRAAGSAREVASGHSVNARLDRTRAVEQSLLPAEAAAGALALSAADLVRLGADHVEDQAADQVTDQVTDRAPDAPPGPLPPEVAALMRAPLPAAEPFGLADGWGAGLALFRGERADWVGHDGNADGTACYLRVDPAGGWVVALTSNANTGLGLWRDVQAELADMGVPLPRPAGPVAPRRGRPVPECAGLYRNGDVTYEVVWRPDGKPSLSVDGDAAEELAVAPDMTFAVRDAATGEWSPGGRFVQSRAGGRVNAIQLGGRLATRAI